MIAKDNPAIDQAITTVFHVSQDELIRQAAERREEYYIHERATQQKLAEQATALQEKDAAIQEKDDIIRQLQEQIQSMKR